MQEQKQTLLDFLSTEGFHPNFDEQGDIAFKCEGWTYVICFDKRDPQFAKMILPGVWEIDDSVALQDVLEGLDEVNRTMKVVKGYTQRGNVSFAIEMWLDNPAGWVPYMQRAVRALAFARSEFGQHISICHAVEARIPVDATIQ